jgi:hypothetical protein
LCCQVEVSATCRSLVQRGPTDCGVCLECDQVKINNLDTCCQQVEEGRTAKRRCEPFSRLHLKVINGSQILY